MTTPTGKGWARARRAAAALLTAAATLSVTSALATADVGSAPAPTDFATSMDAAWLAYAPAPPDGPGVVCLIDSGVSSNPDTQGLLTGSYSVQTQNTDDPYGHGTYMAMFMAAPDNGWGMVGLAPTSVRVFDLKGDDNDGLFPFGDYTQAIYQCKKGQNLAAKNGGSVASMKVISMSLGGQQQALAADEQYLDYAASVAQDADFNLVGAAGNAGLGQPTDWPAADLHVLAVGAIDTETDAPCTFASDGPPDWAGPPTPQGHGVSVWAPGCDSAHEGQGLAIANMASGSPAYVSGSSAATALVSALLASLRAYAPGLTAAQAQACVTSTLSAAGEVDGAAAFAACGLSSVVSTARADETAADAAAAPAAVAQTPPTTLPPPETINVCQIAPQACPPVRDAPGPATSTLPRSGVGSFEGRSGARCARPRLGGFKRRHGRWVARARNPSDNCEIEIQRLERRGRGRHRRLVGVATIRMRSHTVRLPWYGRIVLRLRATAVHGKTPRSSSWEMLRLP